MNILCILEPLDGGQTPPIESVLEGRHFSVVGFSGVRTINMASIIGEMDSQEYSVYFRTIRQRVDAPDRKCSRRQALFRSWILGGWALWAQLPLLLKWTLRNIICISEPLDRVYKPPVESTLEGRHVFAVRFRGVRTMGVASVIVEMDSQEYTMYSRTIRLTVDAPDRQCSRGQALFCSWIFGSVHYQHG